MHERVISVGNFKSEDVESQFIKVGDLLILRDNMIVPADCILIKTLSNEKGQCSIRTGQLDGERSLKEKYALSVAPGS